MWRYNGFPLLPRKAKFPICIILTALKLVLKAEQSNKIMHCDE